MKLPAASDCPPVDVISLTEAAEFSSGIGGVAAI
jgi:hypothetical protein